MTGAARLVGFVRIVVWQKVGNVYGEHYLLVATTVSLSLVSGALL